MRSNEHTHTSSASSPRQGHGKFDQTMVDGLIYGGRANIDISAAISLLESFSQMVPKGTVRKDLRHFSAALGFENVSHDELNNAKQAIMKAKLVKRNWYNQLSADQQEAIGTLMSSQDASKTILTAAANRSVGLDATFGILDVSNNAALKLSTLNSLNRVTGGKLQVATIQDRDVKAVLEKMSSATAFQITQYKHWDKIEKSVRELCAAVGSNIQNCVYSKVTGLPGASEKTTQFVASINPGVGRAAAEPVRN